MIGDIFQPTHLLLLLAVVLLVLGPKRLPEVAKSLGRGFRDFKDAISGEDRSHYSELQQHPIPPAAAPVPPDPVATSHAAEPVGPPSDAQGSEPFVPPLDEEADAATPVDEPAAEPVPAPEAPEPEPVGTPSAKDSGEAAS